MDAMPAGKPCTILIVDDEPFILSATAMLLRNAGHEVHTCAQWTGVAASVRAANPDLVLLDYNMPSIKGDDLCAILKRNMTDSNMRIFMFSAEPEIDLIEIVRRCGADGYIRKSIPGHDLLREIQARYAETQRV
jgi:two-component system OmpR family response regulator